MIEHDISSLWWEEIQGPRFVRNEIYDSLKKAKPVILFGQTIPWLDTLRTLINTEVQEKLDISPMVISEFEEIGNPGEYLLKRFGKSNDVNNYRAGIDPSFPEYLKNIRALENKFIYKSGVKESEYNSWVQFLNQYKSKTEKDGIFLIQTDNPVQIPNTNKITTIDIMSKISDYDILSFSMLLASELSANEIWKQYTAWTTALLFNKKIESLANVYSGRLLQSSVSDYHTILKTEICDEVLFDKSLWTAQLQILFPIIENLRLTIINNHKAGIETILQTEDCFYCDKKVTDPYDAELGFLLYLSWKSNRKIFTADTYKNVQFLHECRNRLAHLEYCGTSDIDKIIGLYNSGR